LPSVSTKVNLEEQVAIGGRMLLQMVKGQQPDPLHVVIPVELVDPNTGEERPSKRIRQKRGAARKSE
jgi:hypothetical protein